MAGIIRIHHVKVLLVLLGQVGKRSSSIFLGPSLSLVELLVPHMFSTTRVLHSSFCNTASQALRVHGTQEEAVQ